jgi:hypothetical protein
MLSEDEMTDVTLQLVQVRPGLLISWIGEGLGLDGFRHGVTVKPALGGFVHGAVTNQSRGESGIEPALMLVDVTTSEGMLKEGGPDVVLRATSLKRTCDQEFN